ncbi:TraR/DksA C4-type zinc finger protein [Acinetobacter baumannii]|uniref:TraR/DksA C4-type zinc finger protein n=1 Tax=Acinetobacter baumannii TaxID=470 RepID=UPI00233F977C|nr:TraR/DksA C4-type zinc finger protein [Acinetobacter baumannii]
MADLVDVASEIIEANVAYTLSHTNRFDDQSNIECEECGTVIPEQRRKLGGVTRCIGCQTEFEAKQKHMRG